LRAAKAELASLLRFTLQVKKTYMFRKCPVCKSSSVRRSAIHKSDAPAQRRFHSPYRCNDCDERFWVLSKTAYYGFGIIGAVMAAGAIGWSLGIVRDGLRGEPERAARDTTRFATAAKLAENNNPAAEYELARMYAQGDAVPQNAAEGRKWLERAAQHGNGEAQYELGMALKEGRGVVQDYERAVKWLHMAAESGHGPAQFELRMVYRAGTGVPAPNGKAYTWLHHGAAQWVAGAAPARDAVLKLLSPADIIEAQAVARRLSETN